MSDRVTAKTFVEVLLHHGVSAMFEGGDITVWKDSTKKVFQTDEGFISKRFVHRAAREFDIDIHYFFRPELLKTKTK